MGRKKLDDSCLKKQRQIRLADNEWEVFKKHKLLKVVRALIKNIIDNEENKK